MTFVDTSGWYALFVSSDPNHIEALSWLRSNEESLITTNYIVDETLTLLRARGNSRKAIELGDKFFDGQLSQIHLLSESEIFEAWMVFRTFADKQWSFTDCTSKVLIDSLSIRTALAFDKHFSQFGNVTIVI
jgi:predicted nucleic acid-binding protein